MGPASQTTPHVNEMETGHGAARCWRGQSSPMARLPAVTSSRYDQLDQAHRLHYLAGPIVDASDDGGGHGGSKELDGGATPVETTTTPSKARTSINKLR